MRLLKTERTGEAFDPRVTTVIAFESPEDFISWVDSTESVVSVHPKSYLDEFWTNYLSERFGEFDRVVYCEGPER